MTTKGHHHKQALCAVANRLVNRIFRVLRTGEPYGLRDLDGRPVEVAEAKMIIAERYTVPPNPREAPRQPAPAAHKAHDPLALSVRDHWRSRSAARRSSAGYSVLFTGAMTLVASLAKAHGDGRLDERLTHFAKPKLLIVDELGYLPLEPDAAHLFFQLVSRRYERGAMLITSNRAVGEWGAVFGDAVVATAILDRLLHHSHVITIRGDSYRLREKRRSGLLQKPAAAPETETAPS